MRNTLSLLALLAALWVPSAHSARADQQGGWELMLTGALQVPFGEPLRLTGVAYSVSGLDNLRPHAGVVEAELRHYDPESRSWSTLARGASAADREGRFALDVVTPTHSAARLQLRVRVGGEVGRWFEHPVRLQPALRVELLTDRRLYHPGEAVHVFALARHATTGVPAANATVALTVTDPAGRALLERSDAADASGSVSADLPLPESATNGRYDVVAQVTLADGSTARATHRVTVGQRTVERLLAELHIDQRVVRPRQRVTGRVSVRTPSGAPVVGARVVVAAARGESTQVTTDGAGVAVFELTAPSYLSGDTTSVSVTARVHHAGHGALLVGGSYVLARTRFQVEVHAASGGLVPGVATFAYLRVSDPLREPPAEGTSVIVAGPAVRGGRHAGVTDAHGLVQVPIELAAQDVAPVRADGYRCPRGPATLLDIAVGVPTESASVDGGAAPSLVETRSCVAVARDALVIPRVTAAVVDQGGEVLVELQRRDAARGQAVLVEVLGRAGSPVLASAWADARSARVSLRLPGHALGVLTVRARPVAAADARAALTDDGAVGVGQGASDAVLVRHADAFALRLAPDREVYEVGGRAEVLLEASPAAPQQAWATLVARDLAAHGGEPDYALPVLEDALRAAVADHAASDSVLVRATLAATLTPDSAPHEPPPLVRPPWDGRSMRYRANTSRGVHRDPLAAREELRRRRLGRVMRGLENLVARMPSEGPGRDDLVQGEGRQRRFRPDVLAHLHQRRRGADHRTLGGETMTVAMLTDADPSFDFEHVARRVARAKLLRLMVGITAFTDPNNADAARASAGVPPEEWLSRLVRLGAIEAADLLDPWGHPFLFRRAGSRTPPLALSDRAPGWELVSAGADGRAGNGDDVRSPFERVLPRGTVYAVASGEDALMRRLALLAPGPGALGRMLAAYTSISQAARDEASGETVSATASEGLEEEERRINFEDGALVTGELLVPQGEALQVRNRASSRRESHASAMGARPAPDPEPEPDGWSSYGGEEPSEPADQSRPRAQGSALASLGERIREDFPATAFFVGRVPLSGPRTPVTIPLADALTTYRVEAIAWSGSGFLDVARATLRVDQSATVDSPVPPSAIVDDAVRLPVRVANRTDQPLDVLVDVTAEGLQVVAPAAVALTVPPRDAAETTVALRFPNTGDGHLVVRAVRADTGAPLDAVRRPLSVLADARLVRVSRQVLVGPGQAIQVDVPADASERGPGELRVASGVQVFGGFDAPNLIDRAWTRRMAGVDVPVEELRPARALLQAGNTDASRRLRGDATALARAVASLWPDHDVSDAVLARGLRAVTRVTEGEVADPGRVGSRCAALLGLVPALRAGGRAALEADLLALVGLLRAGVGDGAARMSERHSTTDLTCAAAALTLTRGAEPDPRAAELLRRAGAFMVPMGDGILVDDPTRDGLLARTLPTAYTALAMIGQGRPAAALRFLRAQADVAEAVTGSDAQALSVAALAMLSSEPPAELAVSLDGRALTVRSADGVHVVALEGLGRPGRHTVAVDTPVLALVHLDVRYGRPWTATPAQSMAVDIELGGDLGARDRRAELTLTLRSRVPRTLQRGVAELDLPAGVELDQPLRDALSPLVRSVSQVGRTLVLQLRPLPAGGTVTLPLALRPSVSGQVRGLGVSVYDDHVRAGRSHGARPAAVLSSRALSIPDAPEPASR